MLQIFLLMSQKDYLVNDQIAKDQEQTAMMKVMGVHLKMHLMNEKIIGEETAGKIFLDLIIGILLDLVMLIMIRN